GALVRVRREQDCGRGKTGLLPTGLRFVGNWSLHGQRCFGDDDGGGRLLDPREGGREVVGRVWVAARVRRRGHRGSEGERREAEFRPLNDFRELPALVHGLLPVGFPRGDDERRRNAPPPAMLPPLVVEVRKELLEWELLLACLAGSLFSPPLG